MNRRRFLQSFAVMTSAMRTFRGAVNAAGCEEGPTQLIGELGSNSGSNGTTGADIGGHTLLCEFKTGTTAWKVYEDLRTREGVITFLSSTGATRVLTKSAEAAFAEADPPYLGLDLKDIGMSGPDLLADRLLLHGDPDPEMVKSAAPPIGSASVGKGGGRPPWNTFVGTKECFDTMPVFPTGNTRTYRPVQYFPEINPQASQKRYETYHPLLYLPEIYAPASGKRFDGLIGGWMPAVRMVMPISDTAYYEILVFGDVEARDEFIVQTWHRAAMIENGEMRKVVYGHTYPEFSPRRQAPKPEEFYRGLFVFADYWDKQLRDFAPASLPQNDWIDMSKHAFAKELMVRPRGVYPKYGAVDRDYYGSEYDGFQDVFTMATYANLEWGRFEMARAVIDNYFTDFVDSKGMINMRGPETAQFGMTLSLLARYFNYTGDRALLLKHHDKIEASATFLTELHDESLQLPEEDPGHGLIHGWSESDSCLAVNPMTWRLPYFANSAYAARGLKDISQAWLDIIRLKPSQAMENMAWEWHRRSKALQQTLVTSIEKNVCSDMAPPYIGVFPGARLTFRESMEKEWPSPQLWVHRAYAELLQADMLPSRLANIIIDCMRAYGGTTLGVVANVAPPHPEGRDILGFISYGYAQMLLRLDRIEEFLLFLYSHRYHSHTRGSWTAGEVSGIDGDTALFCMPAQQTVPLLVRWMLVLEDSDAEKLYLAKGVPRDWVTSGKEIKVEQAPTRWGRVNFMMVAEPDSKSVTATAELTRPGAPEELHVKLRLPPQKDLRSVTVNGQMATLGGPHKDTVVIRTRNEKRFEVIGQLI